MDPVIRIRRRYQAAGKVVKLPSRPKVPTLLIGGRKYVLSDYFPLGEAIAGPDEESSPGGARVIDVGGNRFRYLWAYDTDRKVLAMWRHSDGDEKFYDRGTSHSRDIVVLEKKGQLNRVTRQEMAVLERFMAKRNDESSKRLKEWAEELTTDLEHQARKVLTDYFEAEVQPVIERKLDEVRRGVVPLGFKVSPTLLQHKDENQQARQYVVTQTMGQLFTQPLAYALVSRATGIPDEDLPQDVQWAWFNVQEKKLEELL